LDKSDLSEELFVLVEYWKYYSGLLKKKIGMENNSYKYLFRAVIKTARRKT